MTVRQQWSVVALFVLLMGSGLFAATRIFGDELFPVSVGTRAPDFQAVTLDAHSTVKTLDDYKGQVVLLNIWATWCAPCRVEMPSIEALYKDYASKGLKVVAVSIDDPGTEATIRAFAQQYGLTFEILHDPQAKISEAYDISGYPETFIVGRDGVIRRKLMSATDWNSPDARALVDRLLAERTQ